MVTRVVVLGAGFGGLELATQVSEACADTAEVTLIDKAEGFVFGFSKLDVMFGRIPPDHAFHPYSDLVKPSVNFVNATVTAIDPTARYVETDAGAYDADLLVVALGADVDPDATPGLVEHGHEFYSVGGAFSVREVLATFRGGKVVIAVTSTPFKCPPAPSETALLMDEYLTAHGLRNKSEIHLVMPFGAPIPPSPAASSAILKAFEEHDIAWHPELLVRGLDATTAQLSDGTEMAYDLFLGVPVHRAPEAARSMTVDGWIPVDPLSLETRFPGVYAVGDVTSVGTPKAGVFAEGQAAVAAARVIATINAKPGTHEYDGRGICYMEFGGDRVAKVDVTFRAGERPYGGLEGPSVDLVRDKATFGAARIQRWFHREWSPAG